MEWRKLLVNRDKLMAEGESVKWEKIKLKYTSLRRSSVGLEICLSG